jgi:S-adenosylmethionine:tRNA ribosyltransferase-isomerase
MPNSKTTKIAKPLRPTPAPIPSLLPDYSLDSYDYLLPPELIAERPSAVRDGSRLLVYHQKSGSIQHAKFSDLATLLPEQSLLVLNQSKVFPCRLRGTRVGGSGKVEVFILSLSLETRAGKSGYRCLVKTNRTKKIGEKYLFQQGVTSTLVERLAGENEGEFLLAFENIPETMGSFASFLAQIGSIPIPPYIRKGESDAADTTDYQTVYASESEKGSVAAPTAGLHFTQELLQQLQSAPYHHQIASLSLHVGMGTFSPVKTQDIREHAMHREHFHLSQAERERILVQYHRQAPVIAVGTTSLRVLESLRQDPQLLQNEWGSTKIFLYPGPHDHQPIQSIQGLITNFHLPKSTLLMLVSAFIGREKALELYREAIQHRYRFFSYGDAMLILR